MSTISSLRIPAHVRSVIDADGAVVLDVHKGTYYSLNSVGVEVWTRLEAGLSLNEIEQALANDFCVPSDLVAQDLKRFVDKLCQKSLVDVVE